MNKNVLKKLMYFIIYNDLIDNFLVEVLCTEEDTRKNHAEAFKFIVEKCLHFKVKWITSRSKASFKGKYFLLCRVNSRIPEDAENVVKLTGFGKIKCPSFFYHNPNKIIIDNGNR